MASKPDTSKTNNNAKKETSAQTPTSQPNEKLNVLEEDDEFEEFEDGKQELHRQLDAAAGNENSCPFSEDLQGSEEIKHSN